MNKIINFSIDDCIEIFRDITINNYNSLFESDYFSFFKELHDKYDAKISLYSFVEYKEFNIKNTTDKFKKEFINNCNWLKIGFHGFNENRRYNDKENIKKDYKLFLKYIKRFAGNLNIIDNFIRLHYFSGNLENMIKIKKFGIKGLFTADDDRDNYYLKKNENIFLNKHNIYKDIKNEIFFIKTNFRIEKIENINETLKTIDINNNIIMFTHEQYLNNKNIRDKIIDIYEYSKETHKPDFINFVEYEFKDIKSLLTKLNKDNETTFKNICFNIYKYFGFDNNEKIEKEIVCLYDVVTDEKYIPTYNISSYNHIITTIHASKGLEFEQVVIQSKDYNLNVEEDLYLHYVAVSRPKEKLLVLIQCPEQIKYINSIKANISKCNDLHIALNINNIINGVNSEEFANKTGS